MYNLKTQRLILRHWCEEDLEPFAAMNRDPEVMKYFPSILSRQESNSMVERIQNKFAIQGFGLWAVEEKLSGTFIGCIGLNRPNFQAHFTPAVEVGWRLARPFWGKGYATEGAKKAIEYGFQEVNLAEIVSFTAKINKRSIAVMERLGMTHQSRDDFNHPNLPSGHILEPHLLYRLSHPGQLH